MKIRNTGKFSVTVRSLEDWEISYTLDGEQTVDVDDKTGEWFLKQNMFYTDPETQERLNAKFEMAE